MMDRAVEVSLPQNLLPKIEQIDRYRIAATPYKHTLKEICLSVLTAHLLHSVCVTHPHITQ